MSFIMVDMNINIIGMMACDWAGPVIFYSLYYILNILKRKKSHGKTCPFSPQF